MSKTYEIDYDANTVIETLLFLVSRYQKNPESRVRLAIVEHMAMLEHHPSVTSDSLRNTAKRLQEFWSCDCDLKKREDFHQCLRPKDSVLH